MAIEESVNNLWPLLENKNEDKQNMSLHKITFGPQKQLCAGEPHFRLSQEWLSFLTLSETDTK